MNLFGDRANKSQYTYAIICVSAKCFSSEVYIRLYLACAIHYNHFQTLRNAHISRIDSVNKRDKVFKVKLQINFHSDSMLFTYIRCKRGTIVPYTLKH